VVSLLSFGVGKLPGLELWWHAGAHHHFSSPIEELRTQTWVDEGLTIICSILESHIAPQFPVWKHFPSLFHQSDSLVVFQPLARLGASLNARASACGVWTVLPCCSSLCVVVTPDLKSAR
jgi:hypothetical protein